MIKNNEIIILEIPQSLPIKRVLSYELHKRGWVWYDEKSLTEFTIDRLFPTDFYLGLLINDKKVTRIIAPPKSDMLKNYAVIKVQDDSRWFI